jgi:hypothetical protein
MTLTWWKTRAPEEPLIPWWVAGVVIGLLLTLAVAIAAPIGMSREFAYTGGRLVSLFVPQVANNPYWQGKLGIGWETMLVLGAFLGGALAAWLTRKPSLEVPSLWVQRFGADRRKRYLVAFVGGFIMLFGARLAGGMHQRSHDFGHQPISPQFLRLCRHDFPHGHVDGESALRLATGVKTAKQRR